MTLTSAPASDAPSVRLYEATARGSLAISQNACQERPPAFANRVASGNSTIRLRYSTVYPSVIPKPGSGEGCRKAGFFIGSLLRLVDLVEDALVSEVPGLSILPAAQDVVDREELQLRELRRELLRGL